MPEKHTRCASLVRGLRANEDSSAGGYGERVDWKFIQQALFAKKGFCFLTCQPHSETAAPKHFAQVVRLVKFWARRAKAERDGFRFKSFMIEMILSHLADKGLDFSDYPEALQHFFTYIARSNLAEQIAFSDFYPFSKIGKFSDAVRIIDPVNELNNVSKLYTRAEANLIVDASLDAGDAIDAALAAPTKQETVRYWQSVFGSAFQA